MGSLRGVPVGMATRPVEELARGSMANIRRPGSTVVFLELCLSLLLAPKSQTELK